MNIDLLGLVKQSSTFGVIGGTAAFLYQKAAEVARTAVEQPWWVPLAVAVIGAAAPPLKTLAQGWRDRRVLHFKRLAEKAEREATRLEFSLEVARAEIKELRAARADGVDSPPKDGVGL